MNIKVTEVQKRDVAIEVLLQEETGKTKAQIAEEYGVSLQWIDRYAKKYRIDALKWIDLALHNSKVMKMLEELPSEIEYKEKPRRGRPPKGDRPIREIVLEVMHGFAEVGEFTKENRELMIQEIMNKTGQGHFSASKYFSGYKKQVGEYQDNETH